MVCLRLEVGAQAGRPTAACRSFGRRPSRSLAFLRSSSLLPQHADLGVEVELFDDVAGVGEDGPQVQARGVVGLDAGHGLEDGADGLDGQGLDAGEDLGLGGLENAVEPAFAVARASAKWVPRSAWRWPLL